MDLSKAISTLTHDLLTLYRAMFPSSTDDGKESTD